MHTTLHLTILADGALPHRCWLLECKHWNVLEWACARHCSREASFKCARAHFSPATVCLQSYTLVPGKLQTDKLLVLSSQWQRLTRVVWGQIKSKGSPAYVTHTRSPSSHPSFRKERKELWTETCTDPFLTAMHFTTDRLSAATNLSRYEPD